MNEATDTTVTVTLPGAVLSSEETALSAWQSVADDARDAGRDWLADQIEAQLPKPPLERVAQALSEFGGAIRGDWGSIDGRSIRSQLDNLVRYLRAPETTPPLADIRVVLDICRYGGGHWTQYCEDYECGKAGAAGERQDT